VDAGGISTINIKASRILVKEEKKQVLAVTSTECGFLLAVVSCVSAEGDSVPPIINFLRRKMKAELRDYAPQ